MHIGFYDILAFVAIIILAAGFTALFLFLGGLPGRLARNRNHPHAEAINLMGWVGLTILLPWIHALIWSMHDSITVDVRKLPKTNDKLDDSNISNSNSPLKDNVEKKS